jgi:hypothetical protein
MHVEKNFQGNNAHYYLQNGFGEDLKHYKLAFANNLSCEDFGASTCAREIQVGSVIAHFFCCTAYGPGFALILWHS